MRKHNIVLAGMVFLLICGLVLAGCGRTMNSIIKNEPSVTGIVKEIYTNSILIGFEQVQGYPDGAECVVSLEVENKDSVTHFSVGDKVTVFYNGMIAESAPMQINTVYAITLLEPSARSENNKG
ncbi:MAG: DUF3221 domain-containing protein [Oscillospiraceae bacterium]|nr:DUF3221 domain-containing protein [Oscillospiraceae bacterium]